MGELILAVAPHIGAKPIPLVHGPAPTLLSAFTLQ
jgi:hypothetical protein